MADIGALLKGISGSLAQSRDYNLAVARASQSAGLRMRQIELQERESELNRLRFEQAREETRIKTLAETEDLKARLRQSKRETEAERVIAEYEEATEKPLTSAVKEIRAGRSVRGGPDVRATRLARKAVTAYDVLDREVPARLEEVTMTPTQRRARKADIELKEAQTVESVRRAARPVGGVGTQTERFIAELLDPNTAPDRRQLIEREMFGDDPTVDDVSTVVIRRILDTLHPVGRLGGREGVPEGIDPNSYEFLKYGARLAKGILGESGVDGIDRRIEAAKEKGFIIAE